MLCLFILTVILFGCAASHKADDAKEDRAFNKWLNHSRSEFVQQIGQPDSTMPDGKGGEVLIYKEATNYKSVMDSKYTGLQYSFRKEIYVNADSLIYDWRAWRRK